MKETIKNKATELINKATYIDASVYNEAHTEEHTEKDIIASDDLVDIFYDLYPKADDLDDRYDELRQLVFDMGLTIVPGEDIIEGYQGK